MVRPLFRSGLGVAVLATGVSFGCGGDETAHEPPGEASTPAAAPGNPEPGRAEATRSSFDSDQAAPSTDERAAEPAQAHSDDEEAMPDEQPADETSEEPATDADEAED